MMEKRIFAFLDLLGFSEYTLTDQEAALQLLYNYQAILNMKISDQQLHPANSYSHKRLSVLADNCGIDSFQDFLPCSDSIFITSQNADKFVKQISCFLFECFNFTSYAYKEGKSEKEITKVTIKDFNYEKDKKLNIFEKQENWYPVLFRGGITFNEVIFLPMTSIMNYVQKQTNNPFGKALVQAVGLEKADKGPRLFCDKEFVQLIGSKVKHFILPLKDGNIFEILWPMIIYVDDNECDKELTEFNNLFIPAANLWEAFNHLDRAMHYYKFVKLIVLSSLKYFKYRGCLPLARNFISQAITNIGLDLKKDDLMNNVSGQE